MKDVRGPIRKDWNILSGLRSKIESSEDYLILGLAVSLGHIANQNQQVARGQKISMQSGNLLPVTVWRQYQTSLQFLGQLHTWPGGHITPGHRLLLCFVWIGTRKYNICPRRYFQPHLRSSEFGSSHCGRSVWSPCKTNVRMLCGPEKILRVQEVTLTSLPLAPRCGEKMDRTCNIWHLVKRHT